MLAIGHAAAGELSAGRMTPAAAGAAFEESVVRLCLRLSAL